MHQLIYYVTASLDGYIARPDGSVDWLLEPDGDEDFGFSEFYDSIDTVLMGRKTYETALSFGDYPYATKRSDIVSRTLTECPHGRIISDLNEETLQELKADSQQNVWLVGGGELAAACFEMQIVNRVIVFVQPILLGEGLPLTAAIGSGCHTETLPMQTARFGAH